MLSPDATRLLASLVLAGLVAALPTALLAWYRRSPYTPAQLPLYLLNLFMTRVLWRAEVRGQVDLAGGAVIVCNHRGPIDPAFIALACPKPVHWMVAKEYFSWPVFGRALRALEAIPVSRGGIDTAATKVAVRYAQRGELVGMFPEGRINTTRCLLLPGRPGAALVALKARVPVVPCYISGPPNDGTSWGFLFMTARTRLVVGRPIDISPWYDHNGDKGVQEELTRLFLREIARLAGVDEYQPELAGRRWKPGDEDGD